MLQAEYQFMRDGVYTVAARVQDNLDGQATATAKVSITNGKAAIFSA